VVHNRDIESVGAAHKVNSPVADDNEEKLPKKLSDQPEVLSKSCYGI